MYCICDFSGGVPDDINITDYTPAAELYYNYYNGVGAIVAANRNNYSVCYRYDVSISVIVPDT